MKFKAYFVLDLLVDVLWLQQEKLHKTRKNLYKTPSNLNLHPRTHGSPQRAEEVNAKNKYGKGCFRVQYALGSLNGGKGFCPFEILIYFDILIHRL